MATCKYFLEALLLKILFVLAAISVIYIPAGSLWDSLCNGACLCNACELASTAIFACGAAAEASCWLRDTGVTRQSILLYYGLMAGLLTALAGGGLIRDLLLSWQRPFFFEISPQLITAFLASSAGAWHCRKLRFGSDPTLCILDYLSLGVFAAVGAMKAVKSAGGLYGDNVIVIAFVFAGATAAGGGLLRDCLLLRRPAVALTTTYGLMGALGGITHIALLRGFEICGWWRNSSFCWISTMIIVAVIAKMTSHMRFVPQEETPK
ncbi:MAG: TRIC cation channel family protein [Alphaproteobacteria bacterium]